MPRHGLALALALLVFGEPVSATVGPPLPPARPFLLELPLPPEIPVLVGLGGALPAGRKLYLPLIAEEVRRHDLPLEIADAVMRVESGYDPNALGRDGERGLMQVMPPTARLLGFEGTPDELAEPATNVRLGVRYLAGAWKLAGGDVCRALMKYRAGHREERMSALSVEYCRRAKAHLAALGSPLAAGPLPAAEFGFGRVRSNVLVLRSLPDAAIETKGSRQARAQVRGRNPGRALSKRRLIEARIAARRKLWDAHFARLKRIEAKAPLVRDRIMGGS